MTRRNGHQEDIAAICSHAHLDSKEYRLFENARSSLAPSFHRPASRTLNDNAKRKASSVHIPLESLAEDSGTALTAVSKCTLDFSRPPALTKIAVTPCAGGCGASTVAATLARQLTLQGHSVLVDDYSSSHTISHFFRTCPIQRNLIRTFMGDGITRGTLHLLFSAAEERAAHVAASIAMLQDELDWVITDCDLDQVSTDAALVLAVCGPEPRSVMNAGAFRRSWQARTGGARPFFLLNNFDRNNEFHGRMRERLAAEVGSQLLPFVISSSNELPEALSEQKTIFESAPEAMVCDDFVRLASWLGDHLETAAVHNVEVA